MLALSNFLSVLIYLIIYSTIGLFSFICVSALQRLICRDYLNPVETIVLVMFLAGCSLYTLTYFFELG